MTHWYETFFDRHYRESHRAYEAEATRREARGALEFLQLETGARILDVPCGTGRHAVVFAEAGLQVTGVDLSAESLELAAERARRAGAAVDWYQMDMRAMEWRQEFDGVACLFHSFGYLGDRGDLHALEAMVRSLKEGGRLLLDLPNRDYYVQAVPPSFWDETDSHWILCSFRFDAAAGEAHTDYTYVPKGGGTPEARRSQVRWYTLPEVRTMLAVAGAKLESVHGTWDDPTFDGEAPKMIIVARKERVHV
ncbi:MAG: methyltransferase domain-containing protein [Thermaerobacterales bacterium]